MRISDVIGLFSALVGSTATLLGAWAYIRSQHPPKGELLRAAFAITVIMASIICFAVFISRATAISINGQQTVPAPSLPVPGLSAPRERTPSPSPASSTPTASPAVTPSPSPTLTPSPSPTLMPSPTVTPSPSPMLEPSPSPKPKKG